jgi:UDPglucose--hexose-1-phosphate uridylyltransferase
MTTMKHPETSKLDLYKRQLLKPDRRQMALYSRRPIDEAIKATSPQTSAQRGKPHLRWHPLREEWVAFASHRQGRTFLPPKEYNILPFENRGVEIGVTLHHPHGQIYAYALIPPIQERMLHTQKAFWQKNKRTLVQDMLEKELLEKTRIIHEESGSVAFIPICARYPYEVWLAPRLPVESLADLTNEEIQDFARTLKTTLLKCDGLWQRPFPYLMALFAAPCDDEPHPEWHFHIEFYPPLRTRDKLKFLAGTELGSGMFVNDSLPEEKAAELRNIEVHLG